MSLSTLKNVYRKSKPLQKAFHIYSGLFWNNKTRISGKNNTIRNQNAILGSTWLCINGNGNLIEIGSMTRLMHCKITLNGDGHHLFIGDNCYLRDAVFWFEDDHCTISLGTDTTIEGAQLSVTEPNSKIEIGQDCMFSAGIDIRNGDSHSVIDLKSLKRINYARNISIGDHVWIGRDVTVLKGVSIGSGAVIGTRSVVTGNISNNTAAAGIPARTVRDNVTWKRERIYE